MKHLFLVSAFFMAFTFGAAAQDIPLPQTTSATASEAVQKGNWLVGAGIGSIGFNFKTDEFNVNIVPDAGYFISDNAAIGAQVQLGLSAYNGGTIFSYGITPFARYYFPEGAAPTHRWFGEARVGLAGSSSKGNFKDSYLTSVYGVGAGYAHFVTSSVALEGILRLTRSHADIDVGSGTAGLSVGVGLQIYLPGSNR